MRNAGWTGVVLTGGKSSRMGQDKAMIEFEGKRLLDRALDLLDPLVADLLVIGDPEKHGHVGPIVIADERHGLGPVGGIVTAMRFATGDKLLVLACDMPSIDHRLLETVKQELGNFTDAAVPVHNGQREPLAAAYHRRCEQHFRKAIENGELKLQLALERIRLTRVEIEPGSDGWSADLFRNLNYPSDL